MKVRLIFCMVWEVCVEEYVQLVGDLWMHNCLFVDSLVVFGMLDWLFIVKISHAIFAAAPVMYQVATVVLDCGLVS